MKMKITKITGRMILDSRANPTLECDVITQKGIFGRAATPSGASKGKFEAYELRDNKKAFGGLGVSQALKNFKKIEQVLIGVDVADQQQIDQLMLTLDGSPRKERLGANTILAVSMASTRAAAKEKNLTLYEYLAKISNNKKFQLPIPFANVLNGGRHAGNKLAMQEFMIAPIKAKSFSQATQMISETYNTLKKMLSDRFGKAAVALGDEGGFAPPIERAEQALDFLTKAIKTAGYKNKVMIAIDVAASETYKGGLYNLHKTMTQDELAEYYFDLIKQYPIISIEDPFDQEDYESWKAFTKNTKIQVVGDDLLVTSPSRIQMAVDKKLCNSLLLKINQVGTISESLTAHKLSRQAKWHTMVSHRSGETEDSYISDLAVGIGAKLAKIGAPARSERTAKYNQLLRIEEELGKKASFAKW
ncbi:phosphopyruvate hydratase [Candidatus Woesearchaeota archaeon]|nr:phosphopyruvate hydratase [Candidatus Woesearchaeota archaeon]